MRKTVLLYPAVRLTALLLSVCFLLTSVFPCVTYAGNSDNGPAITSPAAILMEASTGQVIYEKDTINHWKTVTEPGVQQIRLFADTLGSMKEIKGFIYYPMDSQEKGGAVLADRFMMTRYHCTDTLAFAVRDSLNKIEALKADSLKKIATKENADSLHKVIDKNKDDIQRLTPEEMNRRRTGTHREKKPEQIQVEQHIQKERIEQRKERQMNQRRQQQRRSNN